MAREHSRPWSSLLALVLLCAATVTGITDAGSPAPAAAAGSHTVTTLHFKVHVGPDNDTVCDVVGDLYTPAGAGPGRRMPALLMTNGFGGSKDDQAGLARYFADQGYVALSYSGLGFGGSDCKVTLDDRDWDGRAGSQLVSYLAGAGDIAFTDDAHTTAAPPLDAVRLDGDGDPRVGMLGGSYGGQVQFAVAGIDDRLDAIVPMITWNDLSYSLAPNTTSTTAGVGSSTPGAAKLIWALGFTGINQVGAVRNLPTDPTRVLGCPNFADFVCPALVNAGTTGTLDPASTGHLRHASVSSFVEEIDVPTLLIQGQSDTLFNLNEGIATYEALQKQGTEVKMIWYNGGHSGPTAPGELDAAAPDPRTQAVTKRVVDWFDHHLRDSAIDTGPEFSYFRDWFSYTGAATPAYGTSSRFPIGTDQRFLLSRSELVGTPGQVRDGAQRLVTPASAPGGVDAPDVIGSVAELPLPERDLPATSVAFTSTPVPTALDLVGQPVARLTVQAPTVALTQSQDAGKLVLFLRLLDVGPDGSTTHLRKLTAPVRVPDVSRPFTVRMPALVHRFAPGHRVRLVVAGGSLNYRGGLHPAAVTIATTSGDPNRQSLTLPVLRRQSIPSSPVDAGGTGHSPSAPVTTTPGSVRGSIPRSSEAAAAAAATASTAPLLPDTGGPSLIAPLAGSLLVACGAQVLVRRRLAIRRWS